MGENTNNATATRYIVAGTLLAGLAGPLLGVLANRSQVVPLIIAAVVISLLGIGFIFTGLRRR